MAFPDATLSPSSRLRTAQAAASSSPNLPSVQDLLSQKPMRPPLRSGSKAAPIPDDATTTFTSAGNLWRSLKTDGSAMPRSNPRTADPIVLEEIDTSVSVIEIQPEDASKRRKPPRQKRKTPKRIENSVEISSGSDLSAKATDQPWRKYKSKDKKASRKATETEPKATDGLRSEPAPANSPEQSRSFYFKSQETKEPTKRRADREVDNGPLNIEAAMARRINWTPPAERSPVLLDSEDAPRPKTTQEDDAFEPFGNILASFKCSKPLQPETGATTASEDSGLLRKRKLVELVPTGRAEAPDAGKAEKSPARRKAPKKKTRTITSIATAAFRAPTQPEPATSVSEHQAPRATKPTASGNEKPKPRKRPAKSSKKKPPLPKPILLSPVAALNQVAGQDFVFGTSSQLAREQSPTLLRDLQAALRASNELDTASFTTPLNSDALEPPERRQTLWDAGARDADGDLFDLEVRDFADAAGAPEPATERDPFGYVRCGQDEVSLPELPAVDQAGDDGSFVNLSDILPRPEPSEPLQVISVASESDMPAHRASAQLVGSPARDEDTSRSRGEEQSAERNDDPQQQSAPEVRPLEPSLELFSDAQLAKRVAQYGFKPIKKRAAMIALLARCGQESALMRPGGAGSSFTKATAAGTTRSASTQAATEKRRRGRPRKASVSEEEVQMEPPPSAQPAESPTRRRGRPRKDADSPSKAAKKSSEERTGTTRPKSRAKTPRTVIEVPDSQSEAEGDSSASFCSSPSATFSPAQAVDLSLTVDEDTEVSLATSPTEQQRCLFTYMTKAVQTAPRTTDAAQPSWHEKMLMYDAIVVEDLTRWLNCGQLTRVGWDGEASLCEVKKWCESKSVLCLWEKNLRGQERKR